MKPHRPEPHVPEPEEITGDEQRYPHCDSRILHAPTECWACDLHSDWQRLRERWGIAFTGHAPKETNTYGLVRKELPCPADFNRPPKSPADHRQWGPNQAQGPER